MEKRNTVQKEMVYSTVCRLCCHPTADEIYSAVFAEYPSVSRGTVYRNLNVLCEEGKIKRVRIPDGADHFDHKCDLHFHAQCTECGKVFDVCMDSIPCIMETIKKNSKIRILDYNITFSGICCECEKEMENKK